MKKLKPLLALILSLLMVASLCACGGSGDAEDKGGDAAGDATDANTETDAAGEEESTGDKDKVVLGYSVYQINETMQMVVDAESAWLDAYAEENGIEIEYHFLDAKGSVDTQLSDVESLITMGCDAISIRVVDVDGSVPAFEACRDAGIPSIAAWFGGNTDAMTYSLYVMDNYRVGQMWAQWIMDYAAAHDNMEIKIGYLDSSPAGGEDQAKRLKGLQETLEAEYGTDGQIQVVCSEYVEMNMDLAMSTMEDWMQIHPELNCIVGFNDDSAMGAANVLSAAGIRDDFIILGCDATNWLSAIADGSMDMSVAMDIPVAVNQECNVLLAMARGETNFSSYTEGDTLYVVDSSNIDQYYTAE